MDEEQHFVYDLLSELRRNPRRRAAVEEALRRADRVTQAAASGKASKNDITRAAADVVRLCGFNFGLLIPRMFPTYPFGEPLDFSSRPFMFAMTAQTPGSVITLKAGRQVGKCADGTTQVLMPDGVTTLRGLFDEGLPVSP